MKGIKKLFFGLFISTIIIFSCQVQAKAVTPATGNVTFDAKNATSIFKSDSFVLDDTMGAPVTDAELEMIFPNNDRKKIAKFQFDGTDTWTATSDPAGGYNFTINISDKKKVEFSSPSTDLSTFRTDFSGKIGTSKSDKSVVKFVLSKGTDEYATLSADVVFSIPSITFGKGNIGGASDFAITQTPTSGTVLFSGESVSVEIKGDAKKLFDNNHYDVILPVTPETSKKDISNKKFTADYTVDNANYTGLADCKFEYIYDIITGTYVNLNGAQTLAKDPIPLIIGTKKDVDILGVQSTLSPSTWVGNEWSSTWSTETLSTKFVVVDGGDKHISFSATAKVGGDYIAKNSINAGAGPNVPYEAGIKFSTSASPVTPTPIPGRGIVLDNPIDLNMGYTYDLDDFATFKGIDAIKIKKATATITGGIAKASSTTLGESPSLDPKKLGSGIIIYEIELEDGSIIKSNEATIRVYAEPKATYVEGTHTVNVEFPSVINMEDGEIVGVDGFNVYMGYGGYDLKVYSGKINPTGYKAGTAMVPPSTIESVVNSLAFQNMLASTAQSLEMDVVVTPTAGGEELKVDLCDKNAILYRITFGNNGSSTSTSSSTSGASNFTYKVNLGGQDVERQFFYGLKGQVFNVTAVAGDKTTFGKWSNGSTSNPMAYTVTAAASLSASGMQSTSVQTSSSSSSSSSNKSSSNGGGSGSGSGGSSGDYDDVPKTGESKADIWILWGVLLISILGAGFMIYKRFGLVKAIAQVDAAEAAAREVQEQERIDAEAKEKEERLKVLKDLRNL